MKIGIMQPYAFPYLGYFQLIHAVDRFVLHDDVSFIKQGWINRNRILGDEGPRLFTIPVSGGSSSRRICDVEIADPTQWRDKLLRSLSRSYRGARCFDEAWPVVEGIVAQGEGNLANWIHRGLLELTDYLGIGTDIIESSSTYDLKELKGEERVIEICRRNGATEYINPEGGRDLYSGKRFLESGVRLQFLEHDPRPYEQLGGSFVPSLSIIDVIMFNSRDQLANRLDEFRLVPAEA